ncbi:MAG: hypothetical protein PUC59_03005, partial [Firmicutes bacterium]|nr:hypothetical protein [Bacillota bacterium]
MQDDNVKFLQRFAPTCEGFFDSHFQNTRHMIKGPEERDGKKGAENMAEINRFAVIGGDLRQAYLAQS